MNKNIVTNELLTIKAIIPSTIQLTETSENLDTILTNLEMMENAITYLRKLVADDKAEKLLDEIYINVPCGKVAKAIGKDQTFNIEVTGTALTPSLNHPELFGEIPEDVKCIDMTLDFPVDCNNIITIKQYNPVLQYYSEDPDVHQEGGKWYKEKSYITDEDFFSYAFLLLEGRTNLTVTVTDSEDNIKYLFSINSHIHFRKDEEE